MEKSKNSSPFLVHDELKGNESLFDPSKYELLGTVDVLRNFDPIHQMHTLSGTCTYYRLNNSAIAIERISHWESPVESLPVAFVVSLTDAIHELIRNEIPVPQEILEVVEVVEFDPQVVSRDTLDSDSCEGRLQLVNGSIRIDSQWYPFDGSKLIKERLFEFFERLISSCDYVTMRDCGLRTENIEKLHPEIRNLFDWSGPKTSGCRIKKEFLDSA